MARWAASRTSFVDGATPAQLREVKETKRIAARRIAPPEPLMVSPARAFARLILRTNDREGCAGWIRQNGQTRVAHVHRSQIFDAAELFRFSAGAVHVVSQKIKQPVRRSL